LCPIWTYNVLPVGKTVSTVLVAVCLFQVAVACGLSDGSGFIYAAATGSASQKLDAETADWKNNTTGLLDM